MTDRIYTQQEVDALLAEQREYLGRVARPELEQKIRELDEHYALSQQKLEATDAEIRAQIVAADREFKDTLATHRSAMDVRIAGERAITRKLFVDLQTLVMDGAPRDKVLAEITVTIEMIDSTARGKIN